MLFEFALASAMSVQQVAQLTSDIVWLVEQTVKSLCDAVSQIHGYHRANSFGWNGR